MNSTSTSTSTMTRWAEPLRTPGPEQGAPWYWLCSNLASPSPSALLGSSRDPRRWGRAAGGSARAWRWCGGHAGRTQSCHLYPHLAPARIPPGVHSGCVLCTATSSGGLSCQRGGPAGGGYGHNRASEGAVWAIPGLGLEIRAPTSQPAKCLPESCAQLSVWLPRHGCCCSGMRSLPRGPGPE